MKRRIIIICVLVGLVVAILLVSVAWKLYPHTQSSNVSEVATSSQEMFVHSSSTFQYVNENEIQSLKKIDGSDYRKDERYVYYEGIILTGADPATFVYVGNGYGKDANKVYASGFVLDGADPNTFTILNDTYAKDKRYVYAYGNFKAFENSDASTFTIIADSFGKDAHNVYGRPLNGTVTAFPYADPATFSFEPFMHDRVHVYVEALCDGESSPWGRSCFKVVEGADPATYTDVGLGYTKDRAHVYYGSKILQDADVSTFTVLDDGGKYGFDYAYDKGHIFVHGVQGVEAISNADMSTFERAGGYYYRDNQHVWYGGTMLQDANPASFLALDNGEYYAKDADSVYFGATLIKGADAPSFHTLGGLYTQDKNRTYKEGMPISS